MPVSARRMAVPVSGVNMKISDLYSEQPALQYMF